MSQEKFQQAVNLFKAGSKKQAEELLLEITASDSSNAEAWYGLALCTDVMEKKKFYLEKVLEINPQHSKAIQLLEKIAITPVKQPQVSNSQKNTTTSSFKVLTQKDKWFSGKFDPENVEKALNAYAQQGWKVNSSATATFPSLTGNREEMIVVLERNNAGETQMLEYKVLTQKDKWFTGKFDPENLEKAINAYAKQGWRVRQIATASIKSLSGTREEIIVILEREK